MDTFLPGYAVGECFSQNKDELVIGLYREDEQFFIKCMLSPEVSLMTFPADFRRARKNSVDLFQETIGLEVCKVFQVPFDRSFGLELEGEKKLLFKMHGRRSNVALLKENAVSQLFRKNLQSDMTLTISGLAKEINLDQPSHQDYGLLRKLLGSDGSSEDEIMEEVNAQLASEEYFLTSGSKGKPELELTEPADFLVRCKSPIEASNELAKHYTQDYLLQEEKRQIERILQKTTKASRNYVQKSYLNLESLDSRRSYEEVANIIMANLHQIPKNANLVTLEDFYTDKPIEIKLKQGLSPQKHAENLYRKAKNEKIQYRKIEENLAQKEKLIAHHESLILKLAQVNSHKELKAFIKENNLRPGQQVATETLPYHVFEYANYQIWVGKNAHANDKLTLKHAHKNDLWLHARDVSGSHVLIKNQDGSNTPTAVIEWAAAVAAYFSKRKHDTLCPVIVTPKKFVRKRKGSPPGQVVVDREEVVMVKPHKPQDEAGVE